MIPSVCRICESSAGLPTLAVLPARAMTMPCPVFCTSGCNLVLHPPKNTNDLVDVLYHCGSRCLLKAPTPPWHCCDRSACLVHVSHLQVPCIWRRIEVRCYPPLPIAASCASESRARALHIGHIHHFVLVLHCAIPIWISLALGTVSAQLFVVQRRGTNCACGISSVFAMPSTCPCPTACTISTIFEIFLMFGICLCIACSSP